MTRTSAQLLRIFVTGLMAALPLIATIAIFWWIVSLLVSWLGPGSGFGRVLSALGLGLAGSTLAGYVIGLGIVAAMIFALGLLVEARLQRGLARAVDAVMTRIPLVRTVYDLTQRIVGLLNQRDQNGLQSMRAVWCHFGGVPAEGEAGRAAVLGLLSTAEPVLIGGRPYLGVIVPTAPVPVGGGLLYLPQDWVQPADIGFEAVTSIYVSMGLTSGQHLSQGQPQPPSVPTAGAAATPVPGPGPAAEPGPEKLDPY